MTDSRKKGAAYMNHIARRFSLWLDPSTEGARMDTLPVRQRETHRLPIDGTWRRKGDLWVHPDIYFPIAVECKKREGWNLEGFVNEGWPIWAWWDQAKDQAIVDDAWPMLVFSRNRQPDFVILDTVVAQCLTLDPVTAPRIAIDRPFDSAVLTLAVLDDFFALDLAFLCNIKQL